MSRWVAGKVIRQTEWAKGLFSLFIEAPVSFEAGQFAQLALEETPSLFRPYSFVNAPDDPLLEFYYSLVPEGRFSSQLAALQSGEPVWISRKGLGRFTLAHVPPASSLWLFATGTGLGVFLALLKTPTLWERFQRVILVHSVSYGEQLSHQAEIQRWATLPSFQWVPVVTRERVPERFHKRIPHLLRQGVLEERIGMPLEAQNAQVMLCGNPEMIAEVSQTLLERGLTLNRGQGGQITIESYWKA